MLRNPMIGHVFYRLRYIEMFGTGMKRINKSYHNSLIKLSRAEIEKQSHYNKAKLIRIVNSLSDKNIIYKSGKGRAIKYHLR